MPFRLLLSKLEPSIKLYSELKPGSAIIEHQIEKQIKPINNQEFNIQIPVSTANHQSMALKLHFITTKGKKIKYPISSVPITKKYRQVKFATLTT